jgi:Flp pilus assembly protein TadB
VGRSYMSPIFAREGLLDYVDDDLPILRQTLPHANFALTAATAARATVTVDLRRGRRVDTNLRAAPSLVHLTGARIVGTDASADDVLEVDPAGSGGAASRSGAARTPSQPGSSPTSARVVRVTVTPAASTPVVLGRVLSALALAVLVVGLATLTVRDLREARRRRTQARDTISHPL